MKTKFDTISEKVLKVLLIVVLLFTLTICLFALFGKANTHNSFSTLITPDTPCGFTSTGVVIKNFEDRAYTIVQDKYGWLYYCSSVEGNLIPVLDADGKHTKDVDTAK